MSKRRGYILFAFFYLFISFGLQANLHFCGSNLTEIGLLNADEPSCECAARTGMHCCHNEQITTQIDTPSIFIESLVLQKIFSAVWVYNFPNFVGSTKLLQAPALLYEPARLRYYLIQEIIIATSVLNI